MVDSNDGENHACCGVARSVRERKLYLVKNKSMKSYKEASTDSESEEDRKPAAVETGVETDKQRQDVVEMCVTQAVSKSLDETEGFMKLGMQQYRMEEVRAYFRIVQTAGPDNVERTLISSAEARKGLSQMVNISVAIVDLFCLCKIDLFTGDALGITKWIQAVICKYFCESGSGFGYSLDTNEPFVFAFQLTLQLPVTKLAASENQCLQTWTSKWLKNCANTPIPTKLINSGLDSKRCLKHRSKSMFCIQQSIAWNSKP